MNEDKLMTKYEVMDYLNISRRHFEKLVTEENLPIIKITQNKRYMRLSDLNRYLNTKMVNQPQEITQESQPDFQWNNIWGKWWDEFFTLSTPLYSDWFCTSDRFGYRSVGCWFVLKSLFHLNLGITHLRNPTYLL